MTRFLPSPRGLFAALLSSRGLALLLLLAALSSPAGSNPRAAEPEAAASPGHSAEKMEPIQVEADHMESDRNKNSVAFTGKVVAKQGKLVIRTDAMTVYYEKTAAGATETAKKNQQIQRLVCQGKVEITQGDWVANGDQAEYFSGNRKLILTGSTKVWQNNNMVTGERFVIFLDEGKSFVERSEKKGERVKAFFATDTDK